MYKDEIIDEVWKHRDSYTSAHHHDLAEMVAELKILQERPGGLLVDRRARTRRTEAEIRSRWVSSPPSP